VNLGDTYYTKSGSGFINDNLTKNDKMKNQVDFEGNKVDDSDEEKVSNTTGINKANELREGGQLPSKCLTLIPFRFAIEMVNRGWILRNTLIWHKPNCMPSSIKDRFTVDFEYMFLFSKKQKYYFKQQYEPHNPKYSYDWQKQTDRKGVNWNFKTGDRTTKGRKRSEFFGEDGRNKRTVWAINPKPFKEAHFAVFPEKLCETPIKAGCPEFICKKCGNIREKIIERDVNVLDVKRNKRDADGDRAIGGVYQKFMQDNPLKDKGFTDCGCNAGFRGGIVLDPFFGSGTTGLVALKQSKKFIGIELNSEYIEIANKRLEPYLEQTKLTNIIK